MIQNYVEREESRLNEIVEEAKIKLQMAEVDLKSFRDKVNAIEKAREVAEENERLLGESGREQLRKEREMLRVSEEDLAKELGKWRLMVDRGKLKRK